jgi:hypothetical protein
VASVASAQPPVTGVISPPLSPRHASYSIDARLDPATRTITGSEIIEWRNLSAATTDELWFHLYWNAWRNDQSTWMREAALGGLTFRNRRPEDWARIDVRSIKLARLGSGRDLAVWTREVRLKADATSDGIDLTARQRFIAPDDGNPDDMTVMAVPLPQPVGPGGRVTVEIAWEAHVPRTFARTGAIGNFFFIAQWFPKLGVLEDEGWNCHQFHASTEFFADYGVYDVRLTVPKGWVVGATGVERERRDNPDNTSTHRYYQEDVHDFAWTTSPDYLERTARFERDPARVPEGAEPLGPVEMRLLLQPEHADQAERHFRATRAALQYYGEWFGPYPYGHITIVDPAYQSRADGMEYPTLFTAGTDWLVTPDVLVPESVTVHEAGHQFWYGIVGTNEFEDAWMDEGLNTFSTARVIAEAFESNRLAVRYFGGFLPYVFRDIDLKRETNGNRLPQYRLMAKSDLTSSPSYMFFPASRSRLAMTYAKTALWLATLERHLGWPTLRQIMSTYFQRWRFKHPKPRDFFDIANEVSGQDLTWYLDRVYRSSEVFDYGVEDLRSTAEAGRFRTTVVVRRYGDGIFPVDVLVRFEDGGEVRGRWDGRDQWKLYTYDRAGRAVSAEVDPDRVLLLDVNTTNNSRALVPRGSQTATKWALKWMVWLQDLLLSWAFLV